MEVCTILYLSLSFLSLLIRNQNQTGLTVERTARTVSRDNPSTGRDLVTEASIVHNDEENIHQRQWRLVELVGIMYPLDKLFSIDFNLSQDTKAFLYG